jgi:hypothetical protein
VESELGDAPPIIYTLPDALLAPLAKACVAYRQAAAGLKKKVRGGPSVGPFALFSPSVDCPFVRSFLRSIDRWLLIVEINMHP